MVFGRCQLPCSRLIASEDQHQVRPVGLAHARDAIFGISYCKYCDNFMLKTLRARLTVFDWESAVLPRRAAPDASFLCEAAAWSSEAELEAMESEQFSISLLPSPGHHRANSPVQFSRGCLLPSPEARGAVSFRLKDFLYTMASDSEDFGPRHSTAFSGLHWARRSFSACHWEAELRLAGWASQILFPPRFPPRCPDLRLWLVRRHG